MPNTAPRRTAARSLHIFPANEGNTRPSGRCLPMTIEIHASFAFSTDAPTDMLLQFEAADIPEQRIDHSSLSIGADPDMARIPAQDDIGERLWMRADGTIEVDYRALVTPQRVIADLGSLGAVSPRKLPGEAVEYLFDSRYCPADKLQAFVGAEFGDLTGGARVVAMRDWIAKHFSYVPGSSGPETDAVDSFVKRQGICRDYAHVLVAMARASTIPARYVACYAPQVSPPDFHAVAEVFLDDPAHRDGGAWHIVDATGMAEPADTVKIGIGRDAADVSFMTSFGPSTFLRSQVSVKSQG